MADLATSLTNHAEYLAETGRRDEAEALFADILGQFRASSLGSGHILRARGHWALAAGWLGEAVPDLAAAVAALADAGSSRWPAR